MPRKKTDPVDAWEERRHQEKQKMRRKLFRLLRRRKGLAKVRIEYDGYGDEGRIESISFWTRFSRPWLAKNEKRLCKAVEEYVLILLPQGWENNIGACGTVVIDVLNRKVRVVHNDRYETYETHEFEDE